MLEFKGKVVDLSVLVSEELPASWPTHIPFQHKIWNYFAPRPDLPQPLRSSFPYQTRWLIIDEHCGTHFDAPTHFIPPPDSGLPWASEAGVESGDRVPLEDLMGPAAVIDVRHLKELGADGVSPRITPDHIRHWEKQHGTLKPGDVVLLWTGWDEFYVPAPQGNRYCFDPLILQKGPGWPAPSTETIIYLHERGVRTLGIDAPSIGASHDGAPAHWEGLSRRMRYVELLTNLATLPPRGALFIFLPLKIKGSTGGPGRAIAILP